jgi:hypothetical protein
MLRVGLMLGMILGVGCSSSDAVYPVTGTITYQGKTIPKGMIYFDPDETKGTKGGQGFATITESKFDTQDNGRGVRGGTYTIRVLGFDGKLGNERPMGEAIFAEYTESRQLPASKSEITINVK